MEASNNAALRGHFVLLRAGDLRLVLPQVEVGAAEYLEARPQASDEPGVLRDANGRAYCALSSTLSLLPQCPPERFVVATLGDGTDTTGWCWDALQVLIAVELQPLPVPPVLLAPGAPVVSYVELADGPAFLCSAAALAKCAQPVGAAA